MKKRNVEVLKTPEEFAVMTSSQIVQLLKKDTKIAIVGDCVGVDRHIIRYKERKDFFEYKNPYTI